VSDRVILHSDLNGFYAAVECFENPKIRDLPVAVCGDADQRHGIILAKNEIAKKFKIKTGEVIWQAKQKCPDLVTVPAHFDKYQRYSQIVKDLYNNYTDQIEPFGIDEAWLDVTGRDGKKTAEEIRERVKRETGLTVSIGVSWNKIFAKLGSDLRKPDIVTEISRKNFKQRIFPLPANDLLYVGKATKAKLGSFGIKTIGDIANADVADLKLRLGKWGEVLWNFANGFDLSPVAKYVDDNDVKSIGNSTTTMRDLKTLDDVLMIVTVLSESVAARLREQWLKGQVVHLTVRDNELVDWGKQTKIEKPSFLSEDIIKTSMELFKFYDFSKPIRSIGVRMTNLSSADTPVQLDLFGNDAEQKEAESLEHTIDRIRSKHGHVAIKRGIEHVDKELCGIDPKEENTVFPTSYFK